MLEQLAQKFAVVDPHVHIRWDNAEYDKVPEYIWNKFPEVLGYWFKYKSVPENLVSDLLGSESAIEGKNIKTSLVRENMGPGFYLLAGDHNSDGIDEWFKMKKNTDIILAREITVKDNGKMYHIVVTDVDEDNWKEIQKRLKSKEPLNEILDYLNDHFGWIAHPLGKIHRDGISITSLDELEKFNILEINGSHPWYENAVTTIAALYLGKGMIAGGDAHHPQYIFGGATISNAKSWDEFKQKVKDGDVGIYLKQNLDGVMKELKEISINYHGHRILKEGWKKFLNEMKKTLKRPTDKKGWKTTLKTLGGLAILEGIYLASPLIVSTSKKHYYNGTRENSEKILNEIYERLENDDYETLLKVRDRTRKFIERNSWWKDQTEENRHYFSMIYEFLSNLDSRISKYEMSHSASRPKELPSITLRQNVPSTPKDFALQPNVPSLTRKDKMYISRVYREMELAYYINRVSAPRKQIEDMYKLEKRRGLVDLFYAWKDGKDDRPVKKKHKWLKDFDNLDDFVYKRLESLNDYFSIRDEKYAGKLAGILRYASAFNVDIEKYLTESLKRTKLPYLEREFIKKSYPRSRSHAQQIQAVA